MTVLMSLKAVNARCQSPKVVNVGPGAESSKCRTEARCSKCRVEAQKWGRSPKVGLKPDAGPKSDAINAGSEPDSGSEPDVGPEPNAVNPGLEPDAVNAGSEPDAVDRPSGHGSSCCGGRAKAASGLPAKVGTTRLSCGTAGGLPAKVGTTRLSCGVGGRDGRPLVIGRLAMER
ncbi:hypothetical protein CRG98_005317 [Punica granatum]|uniref:Uncharacterized protein n=1 Tax=Punica granatum TaxID=22663 RepID=A0A2I0L0Q9_PUNGR|nr:hypothetical protein CRG98_005317 [Punica granatum]